MKKLTLCIAALLVTFVGVSHSNAQTLTFDLTANDTVVGGTVNWSLSATVTDFSNNFGIDTISADLDSSVDTLTAASVVGFDNYTTRSGGTESGGNLLEIGAFLVQQNSNVLGASGNLGPHFLASGSFIATTQGTHSLTAVAGTANDYFTAANQFTGAGGAFSTVNGASVQYIVSAVPEPGSFAVLGVVGLLGFTRRRRV